MVLNKLGDEIGSGYVCLVRVTFVLIVAVVQLSAAEYVFYVCKTDIEDSLSLNPN